MPIFNSVYKSFKPPYEYSYDFVWKTTSQMETDGWIFYGNKNYATFNTNWINSTSQDVAIFAWIENLSSAISNAKKITISSTWNLVNWFRNELSLYSGYSSWWTGKYWQSMSNAENKMYAVINDNFIATNMSVSWIITETIEIDLENGTWNVSATNGYSNSWTLSSSDISNIRNNSKWIWIFPWWWWAWNSNWWMTNLSIKIEN